MIENFFIQLTFLSVRKSIEFSNQNQFCWREIRGNEFDDLRFISHGDRSPQAE